MINAEDIVMLYAGHDWPSRPGLMKQCYEMALEAFARVGLEPNRLGAKAPGVDGGEYGTFAGKRRYLERADFDQCEHFTVAHLLPGGRFPGYESSLYWGIRLNREVIVAALPGVLQSAMGAVSDGFKSIVAVSGLQYGYCFHQRVKYGPVVHCMGAILYNRDDTRSRELTMNTSWWGGFVHEHNSCPHGQLRDVYPENYLSESYLQARLGKSATTLKEWISADSNYRGTLEPYTDVLTKWTPPIKMIPEIREELYRAGRVFYWRFFCPGHGSVWSTDVKPEPLYRPDLSAPWEAPDPIPEIYRADYWKDKDPGLTY